MLNSIRVLVFPSGTEIAIEIYDALKWQKDIEVFGATSAPDHSEMLYERLVSGLPYFYEEGFVEKLNEVISRWSIDFVYPARDDVQLFLTQQCAKLRARVITSPLHTVEVCRSKKATYKCLANEFFVPYTFESATDIGSFPVFCKPVVGEGSKGAQLVCSQDELDRLIADDNDYVFCEYLPGVEWTVDCFTDMNGELVACLPRTRDRARSGIAMRSTTVDDSATTARIHAIGEAINKRLEFYGAWFFQLKARDDGTPILMEVSPRIPGTMGLSRNLGLNFPLLTIYQAMGMVVTVSPMSLDAMVDKALISRYKLDITYSTLYVDYDDTLVVHGKTNPLLIAFLYQCKNEGKHIVLLTRHDNRELGYLDDDMLSRGIAASLFDEIVHLGREDCKSDYVTERSAIFIDDSYRERMEVAQRREIPTFDVSNIESLLDWRH